MRNSLLKPQNLNEISLNINYDKSKKEIQNPSKLNEKFPSNDKVINTDD